MINIKVTLASKEVYYVRTRLAENVKEFIAAALMPYGNLLQWYEILPGEMIQVSQIESIRELTEEEVQELTRPKEVEDAEILNPDEIGQTNAPAESEEQ